MFLVFNIPCLGHLVPTAVIRAFQDGTLNVHPSRLPRHRGAAPIQHTILAGDAETSVMVIELSEGKVSNTQHRAGTIC
jgi:methionyl-tRNA formyltransferase